MFCYYQISYFNFEKFPWQKARILVVWKILLKLCLSRDAFTRNCMRCSSSCSSWWEVVGLRPGGGVTRSHDSSSSAGVFSHLDGASSNATNGVSPTTWQGLEKPVEESSGDTEKNPQKQVLSWKTEQMKNCSSAQRLLTLHPDLKGRD